MIEITPVVLCGGAGTRLWPLSRIGFPKQFLCLTGEESLFQMAVRRLANLESQDIVAAEPVIVSGEDHRFLAVEQLRESGLVLGAALLEPCGRNTAPALTLAALAALEEGRDPVLVVTPADQTIGDAAAFTEAMQTAIREAADGTTVILGISPGRAETGYGYIQAVAPGKSAEESVARTVVRFVEKPDADKAKRYLLEGNYFWNAGMFVLRASVWVSALECFRPDIAHAARKAWATRTTDRSAGGCFIRPGKQEFEAIPGESVDYAVMEHLPGSDFRVKMVPLNSSWSDLGAWDAVWNVLPKDAAGNAHLGDVVATGSHNTLVQATSRLVTLVGVENLIVIETPDAVLIADKTQSQKVSEIVRQLSQDKREEHVLHRKVHRPWGWYDSVDEGGRFKVKRIQVKPKASLSLQMHHHRAEHWVVVTGTAEITKGDQVILLTENQSTYIPLGEIHRLSNPGNIPLEIIEVQSGSYLGEDDIVRLEDTYGRTRS
ncbi:MAG: hypothetical protein RIS88_340 [Pseudomonadota bacterium]